MCGRFSQAYTWEQVVAFSQPLTVDPQGALALPQPPDNRPPRYNIAPTTEIDIIVMTPRGADMIKARWGLIPAWHRGAARDLKLATFNARVETVDSSGMFKHAYVRRRCIIPASGFFEWTGEKKDRTPHFISGADGNPLAFAGLYERWKSPEGEEIVTATIIVREADPWMSRIHNRMPAMLHPDDFMTWLDGSSGKSVLQQPAPALREWIVSQRVNKAGFGGDDPATVAPVIAPGQSAS